MSFYIYHTYISFIKDLINLRDTEICGFLYERVDNPYLLLYTDSVGEEKGGRTLCMHSKYEKYIWHTHFRGTIAYPSPEDFLKIVKYRDNTNYPVISLIFTTWGVWELFNYGEKISDDKVISYIYTVFKTYFDRLYFDTDRAREWKKEYSKNIELAISKSLEKIRLPQFHVYFTPWSEIKENYRLRSS